MNLGALVASIGLDTKPLLYGQKKAEEALNKIKNTTLLTTDSIKRSFASVSNVSGVFNKINQTSKRAASIVSAQYNRMGASIKKAMVKASQSVEAFAATSKARLVGLKDSVFNLRNSFLTLGSVLLARQYIKLADSYTSVNSRLKLVTTSSKELADVQKKLFDSSQKTRVGYDKSIDLYTNIARTTEYLGLKQKDMLQVTENINKALIVSGTSAASSSAALTQFGQGLAAGVIRGEELNSILEQAPRLAKLIAHGMGIATGALKTMGEKGKLTAEKVIQAILSQSKVIQKEFKQMPITVEQASIMAKNGIFKMVGEFDKATGASAMLSRAIQAIAKASQDMDFSDIFTKIEQLNAKYETTIAIIGGTTGLLAVMGILTLSINLAGVAVGVFSSSLALLLTKVPTTIAEVSLLATTFNAVVLALGVVTAAVMGWKFGTYLQQEFKWVNDMAQYLMISMLDGWYITVNATKKLFILLKTAWTTTVNDMQTYYANFLRSTGEAMKKYGKYIGGESLGNSLIKSSSNMLGTIVDSKKALIGEYKQLGVELEAQLKENQALLDGVWADNDKKVYGGNSIGAYQDNKLEAQLKAIEAKQKAIKALEDKVNQGTQGKTAGATSQANEALKTKNKLLSVTQIKYNSLIEKLKFEQSLIGKTTEMQRVLTLARKNQIKEGTEQYKELERTILAIAGAEKKVAIEEEKRAKKKAELDKTSEAQTERLKLANMSTFDAMKAGAEAWADGFGDTMVDMVKSGEYSFAKIRDNFLTMMAEMVIKAAASKLATGLLGALFGGGIGGFAEGGVGSGWNVVGEEGPELINFGNTSRVLNHQESRRMLSQGRGQDSGRITVNQTLNIGEGVNAAAEQAILNAMPIIKEQAVVAVNEANRRRGR